MSVCPQEAIEMRSDERGFLYPQIDSQKCIDCGECREVCSFNSDYDKSSLISSPQVYAVKHKDEAIRMKSRSGAVFMACADYIINEKKGVVYGCGFIDNLEVAHRRIDSQESLHELQGSKYVQSDMLDCFEKVAEELAEGRYVVFSGTPCQVAGIKGYIDSQNQASDKLFTFDLICHGVPSPKVYRDYRSFMEKAHNKKIKAFDFRDKAYGWSTHIESLTFEDGQKISQKYYTELFYMYTAIRPSCAKCPFTNTKRAADITLGDFWKVGEVIADFDDDKGVSSILVNTNKGIELFENVKEKLEFNELELGDAMQPRLKEPVVLSAQTEKFWRDYEKNGFEYIIKGYTGYGGAKTKLKRKILKKLGRW